MLTESYVMFLFGGLWNQLLFQLVTSRKPTKVVACVSLLRRGLFVLWGGWWGRKRECAGNDGKGEERREAFSLLPAGASAEEREPVRRRLGSWNESDRNWKIEGGRERWGRRKLLSRPQLHSSFLFFALVPTFSTYYQRAASRRGGSIIKPCAKVSRQNESRSDVT